MAGTAGLDRHWLRQAGLWLPSGAGQITAPPAGDCGCGCNGAPDGCGQRGRPRALVPKRLGGFPCCCTGAVSFTSARVAPPQFGCAACIGNAVPMIGGPPWLGGTVRLSGSFQTTIVEKWFQLIQLTVANSPCGLAQMDAIYRAITQAISVAASMSVQLTALAPSFCPSGTVSIATNTSWSCDDGGLLQVGEVFAAASAGVNLNWKGIDAGIGVGVSLVRINGSTNLTNQFWRCVRGDFTYCLGGTSNNGRGSVTGVRANLCQAWIDRVDPPAWNCMAARTEPLCGRTIAGPATAITPDLGASGSAVYQPQTL